MIQISSVYLILMPSLRIPCQHEQATVRAAIQMDSSYWYLLVNGKPQVQGSSKAHTPNSASFSHQLSPPTQGQPRLFLGPVIPPLWLKIDRCIYTGTTFFSCSQRLQPDLVHTWKEEVHYNVFMDGLCETATVGNCWLQARFVCRCTQHSLVSAPGT